MKPPTETRQERQMAWFETAEEYDKRTWPHDGSLESFPSEWQREMVALLRLEQEVNNGGYLQFLANCRKETYNYAATALKKVGAHKMAEIIDRCQALIDEHFPTDGKSSDELTQLMPNPIIGRDGETVKDAGSVLPDFVLAEIYDLSYQFMDYPDDLEALANRYFDRLIENEKTGDTLRD